MALTPPSTAAVRSAAVACVLVAVTVSAVIAAPAGNKLELEGTDVDAKSVTVNNKKQTADYEDIVLQQDDIKVQADRAHVDGLTLDKADWKFEGNVRVESEQRGNMHSDRAVVEFRDKRVTRVTVNGMPAQFEQKRADSDQITRGHADEIVYDLGDGTIRLSGKDAWLSDGRNQVTSPIVLYNIREQRFEASTPAGTNGRVHMTITPSGKVEPKTQP
jgi:lipopolysaccharide transport protein LptA